MAKKNYGLAPGVTLFVDDETDLKMVSGQVAKFDEAGAGAKTVLAIRNRAIIEVEEEAKTSNPKEKTETK